MTSLKWKSHPARERPVAAIFVSVFILIIFYLVYEWSEDGLMVLMAAFIFLVSLSTFYFPTKYSVDETKATIKYLFTFKERNLSAFRAVFPGQRGILLSPYLGPTRLENFRGFYLRYGKDNKEEVDRILSELISWRNEKLAENVSRENQNAS